MSKSGKSLDEVLEELSKVFKLLSLDKFQEAFNLLSSKQDEHFFFKGLHASLLSNISLVNFSDQDLEQGLKTGEQALNVIDSHRRKKSMVSSLFFTPDYDSYSDDEVQAELAFAETCLLVASLVINQKNRSFSAFITAALYVRKSYSTYQECLKILNKRTKWESIRSKQEFECGVRWAIGCIDMGISFVPPPFSTVLNFIGYSGDRVFAERQLTKAYQECPLALRRPMIGLTLFVYHGVAVYVFGLEEQGNRQFMKQFVEDLASLYPDNIYQDALNGALLQSNGDFETSACLYDKTASHEFYVKKLSVVCLGFKLGSLFFLRKWKEAEEVTRYFQKEAWSPATASYARAIVLFMMMTEEGVDEETKLSLRKEMVMELRSVPEKKRVIAGHVYHELYVLESAKRFMNRPESMILPVYEVACLANAFAMFSLNESHINPILDRISLEFKRLQVNEEDYFDKKVTLLFIQGCCYKQLNRLDDAKNSFGSVLEIENAVMDATHIPAHSCYELGNICRSLGDEKQARSYFKQTLSNYSKYSTEILVNYKSKMALEDLKSARNSKENEDSMMKSVFDQPNFNYSSKVVNGQ